MKPKKRKLSGKLLGVIQCLSQTYKQKLFFFFAGVFSFCNGCFILSPYQKRWWKKKLHLNLTCLYLSVIFPDDFSSIFSPLTICLWHIPQSEKEPKLSSVILDGFYFDLFYAFSSKNSWLLPCAQNDHMRFRGMKIFCLSIVMSCSHDDSLLVSFQVYRVSVNSSFNFSQKRKLSLDSK